MVKKAEAMKTDRLLVFFVLLSYVVFSLVVSPGYKSMRGDQVFYVEGIFKTLGAEQRNEVELLPALHPADSTIYDEMAVFLHSSFGLDFWVSFFLLEFFFRLLMFYSLYALVGYFTGNGVFSLVFPALFLFSPFVFGPQVLVIGISSLPRFYAICLGVSSIVFVLRRNFVAAATLIFLAWIMQPGIAVIFMLFFLAEYFRNGKSVLNAVFLLLLLALFSAFLVFFVQPGLFGSGLLSKAGQSVFLTFDLQWEGIAREFNPTPFVSEWDNSSLLHTLALFLMFAFGCKLSASSLSDEKRLQLLALGFIAAGLFAVSFVSVDLLKSYSMAVMQLVRGLILLKIFGVLVFGYSVLKHVFEFPVDRAMNFALAGALVSGALYWMPLPFFSFAGMLVALMLLRRQGASSPGLLSAAVFILLSACLSFLSGALLPTGGMLSGLIYVSGAALMFAFIVRGVCAFFRPDRVSLAGKWFAAALVFLLLVPSAFFLPAFSPLPEVSKHPDVIDACVWITENTSQDDVFLFLPFVALESSDRFFLACNTVHALPPTAGHTLFDRDFAIEYWARLNDFTGLTESNDVQIFRKYNVSYVVSDRELVGVNPLRMVYWNSGFFIYRVEPPPLQ